MKFKWFKRKDSNDDFLLGGFEVDPKRKSHHSVYMSMCRPWGDWQIACQCKDCVRPSAYTVLTYEVLDVDISGSPSRLRNQGQLPTYQEYKVCDRCYESKLRGRQGNRLVLGPERVYDPEKHEETQRKLQKLRQKISEGK